MEQTGQRRSWFRKNGKIRKRWKSLAVIILLCALLSQCSVTKSLIEAGRSPEKPFDETKAPPAPDYVRKSAWLAFPGTNGIERSVPAGFTAIDETTAPADVFFIHPTMYLKNDVWNAPYDVAGAYNSPVLLGQVSAFNGCCLMYAPHYRQASLTGLKNPQAVALAYSDIVRAFRYYIAHLNRGRPFIIASHSQGTGHAVRLLQEAIVGTPLQKQLVAAYTIGAYTPSSFADIGLPICDAASQTGCVLSWNSAQEGRRGAELLTEKSDYWWQGKVVKGGTVKAICVNPLTWTQAGKAGASANDGSLGFPAAPFPAHATALPALTKELTGAVCHDALLDVDLPWSAPSGTVDALALLYGSYHKNDYGLFYTNIRANAVERVASWQKQQRAKP
jgi:hypothetical protein